MFYMYMFIRYRYNVLGMCENFGFVFLIILYIKNVNLKLILRYKI